MELFIVLFVVLLAAVYSVIQFAKVFKSDNTGCGCSSSCSGCSGETPFETVNCREK